MARADENWTDVRGAEPDSARARDPGARHAEADSARPGDPDIRRREVLFVALAAVGLALLMHWPLPLHIGRDVPRDLGDPLPQAWQVAWDGHALAHQPLDFFQANVFWPLKNSLAF